MREWTFPELHIEWWSDQLQFSCPTFELFWVFNQAVIPWLAMLCVLQEKKMRNYVFIGICSVAAGPLPTVGIAVYMLLNGIYKTVNSIIEKSERN